METHGISKSEIENIWSEIEDVVVKTVLSAHKEARQVKQAQAWPKQAIKLLRYFRKIVMPKISKLGLYWYNLFFDHILCSQYYRI